MPPLERDPRTGRLVHRAIGDPTIERTLYPRAAAGGGGGLTPVREDFSGVSGTGITLASAPATDNEIVIVDTQTLAKVASMPTVNEYTRVGTAITTGLVMAGSSVTVLYFV